jgi:hypothetical protein
VEAPVSLVVTLGLTLIPLFSFSLGVLPLVFPLGKQGAEVMSLHLGIHGAASWAGLERAQ